MAVKYTIPYKSMDNQPWRIDIADRIAELPVFNYSVTQASPLVEAVLSITDTATGEAIVTNIDPSVTLPGVLPANPTTGTATMMQGHAYRITASMANMPSTPNPRLRLTVYENTVLIFDKSIAVLEVGDSIVKLGVALTGCIYHVVVTGDYNDVQVTPVDIESDLGYVNPNAPIPVRGNGNAGVIVWTADNTDDPFACYKSSTLTMNLIQEGQINIDELQLAQDKDFMVSMYRNEVLYWQGFLVPDGIERPLLSTPNSLTLTAICGLTMLTDIPYVHTDLQGIDPGISFCPMNYIRDILFLNLGNYLPIRWTNLLQCTAFEGQDVFIGGVQWSVNGEGYISYQSVANSIGSGNTDGAGPPQKCDYILKGILQAMQCCIYLADGRWNIRRIPDVVRNSVPYTQISGNVEMMIPATGFQNMPSQIGRFGFSFINENAISTVKQGVQICRTTYTPNVRANILPNGSFDYLTFINPLFTTRYWGVYDTANPYIITADSLDGRKGYSADLIYEGIDPADQWFTMFTGTANPLGSNGLPIDTNIMVWYIIFGFLFEITGGGGFPLNGDGTINWTDDPFRIKVILNLGEIQYFLNPYGFWVTEDTYIPISVPGLSPGDVATIDFNKFQNIILPTTPGPVIAGYASNIQVLFRVAEGQNYKLDNVYMNIAQGNDVYESVYTQSRNTTTDERTLNISSSFGGYQLSNFMSSPFKCGNECFFQDAAAYTGTLTGLMSNAVMRCRYKSSRILNTDINVLNNPWSFDSTFMADSFNSTLFLPLNASYATEKCQVNGLVAIEIRNDFVDLTEIYYNSNDAPLSN